MPRYKLRTLLIVLAIGPPLLAGGYWAWLKWREKEAGRWDRTVTVDARDLEEWNYAPTKFAHNRKHRIIWDNEIYED